MVKIVVLVCKYWLMDLNLDRCISRQNLDKENTVSESALKSVSDEKELSVVREELL